MSLVTIGQKMILSKDCSNPPKIVTVSKVSKKTFRVRNEDGQQVDDRFSMDDLYGDEHPGEQARWPSCCTYVYNFSRQKWNELMKSFERFKQDELEKTEERRRHKEEKEANRQRLVEKTQKLFNPDNLSLEEVVTGKLLGIRCIEKENQKIFTVEMDTIRGWLVGMIQLSPKEKEDKTVEVKEYLASVVFVKKDWSFSLCSSNNYKSEEEAFWISMAYFYFET